MFKVALQKKSQRKSIDIGCLCLFLSLHGLFIYEKVEEISSNSGELPIVMEHKVTAPSSFQMVFWVL